MSTRKQRYHGKKTVPGYLPIRFRLGCTGTRLLCGVAGLTEADIIFGKKPLQYAVVKKMVVTLK